MLAHFVDFEMAINIVTGDSFGQSPSKLFPCITKIDECNFWFVTEQSQPLLI